MPTRTIKHSLCTMISSQELMRLLTLPACTSWHGEVPAGKLGQQEFAIAAPWRACSLPTGEAPPVEMACLAARGG